jgi:AbrB family looped-hinge helix DNA binding protein
MEATISSKHQIVIPKTIRERLGLKAGDKLQLSLHQGKLIVMEKPRAPHEALMGIAKGLYGPDYLKKERESWR